MFFTNRNLKFRLCIRRSLLASMTSALLLSLAAAQAATLTVTSASDSGVGTLRQAILNASASGGDTINFAAGITTITLTSGELLIDKNLTIDGPGANLLTVQCSSAGAFRVFNISAGTISGLKITGGKTEIGAGIHCVGATIRNCLITSNQAVGDAPKGGGVYCDGGAVSQCVISGNTVTSTNADHYSAFAEGGGIYASGESQIDHSTITNNTLTGYYANGAGINANNGTVLNCTISGNTAYGHWYASGGGVYMTANVDGLIRNCLLTGNNAHTNRGASSANWASGGGVYFNGGGTLESSTVSGNSLDGDTSTGGGLTYGDQIRNSIIYENTATARMTVTGPNYYLNPYGSAIFTHCCSTPLLPGVGNIASVPGFMSGGYQLDTGSPCIDTGLNQPWMAAATDLGGNLRIANRTVDMGAFEFGAVPVPPATLGNVSTRLRVLTGDKVLIGGFIVTGSAPKKVIIRAIGPSLTSFGVTGALADPILELHKPGNIVVTNDNWKTTQQAAIQATGIAPKNDLESAIVATLAPGNYTAIVRGKNNGIGVGLVEAYDLDQAAASQLGNISTRGFVDTGENVMIGGIIVGPTGAPSGKMLIRAIGPSLVSSGIAGPLADPTLELHNGNGVLTASNDNWKTSQQAVIQATGIPPTNDKESAILATLAPGNYTAIVRGKNNTTGVALVEVYRLP